MNPKTRFMKMYYKLPKEARRELIIHPYGNGGLEACSLDVAWAEITHDTELGKKILKTLGFWSATKPSTKTLRYDK